MGLSGPKKKTKISNDPNNTKWARSTSGFGHKIMSSQGWTPGNRLGARNAAHADFLTNASTSHIKVTLKDDNLGLGARLGRETEPTGLDAFKGLLGRLNGKSDTELKQDQRKRDDVKLARYAAMKFPEVRFVYGGPLAQDKEEDKIAKLPNLKSQDANENGQEIDQQANEASDPDSDSSAADRKSSKSKSKSQVENRKVQIEVKGEIEGQEVDSSSASIAESKKEKKSKKRKAEAVEESNPSTEDDEPSKASETLAQGPVTQSAVPRERRPIGRQVFRGRHIAQKKRALLDDKSLNEIFMVKA
ncbi:Protein pxr1 [Penicillium chermesinum]|uniref:Protein PXR1 n=1 Tax=Penicillium chermesinum TaxID=63820 RepID=A0A9W9P0F4_9EURO|nr:Protein pxr1 [Penicillium chermesinum]KAJ5232800.1 Protein pxr1 [Penicillium chermesinum]